MQACLSWNANKNSKLIRQKIVLRQTTTANSNNIIRIIDVTIWLQAPSIQSGNNNNKNS